VKSALVLFALLLSTTAWSMTPAERRLEKAELLQELLGKDSTSGNMRAEAMLKLGNLYVEHGMEIGGDDGRVWVERSVPIYRDVLKGYRYYDGRAQTQYRLGLALNQTDRGAEGSDLLEGVVKHHPDSVWVPYSYHELGEYYFGQRNLYKAITSYRKARTFPENETFAHSTYKLSWCYYNAKDYDAAIDTMKSVFDTKPSNGFTEELKADAMHDLARFYGDARQYDDGYSFFRDNGDSENLKNLLERLAAHYERDGDTANLRKVKRVLDKEFAAAN